MLFATWYDGLADLEAGAPVSMSDFDRLLALRDRVAKVLEPMRAEGAIGAALDAEITLGCNVADQNWLAPMREELRFLFISGDVHLAAADAATEIEVGAVVTDKPKCVRCWQRRGDVGSDPDHAGLCTRCVSNVEGPGEQRRWF